MPADDLRLQPKMTTAEEIVLLVRTVSFETAVKVVTSWGDLHRASGRLEQTIEYRNRLRAAEDNRGGVDA